MSFTLGTEMALLVARSFEMKSGKAHFSIRQEKARLKIPRFQFRFPCLGRKWPVDWIIIFISMSNLPRNVKQSALIFHNVSLHLSASKIMIIIKSINYYLQVLSKKVSDLKFKPLRNRE